MSDNLPTPREHERSRVAPAAAYSAAANRHRACLLIAMVVPDADRAHRLADMIVRAVADGYERGFRDHAEGRSGRPLEPAVDMFMKRWAGPAADDERSTERWTTTRCAR
jgi:hypothetical protein